jgi:hypothetical protein
MSLSALSSKLYAVNFEGGNVKKICKEGCGTIASISPSGSYQVAYTFKGKKDGGEPRSTLYQDAEGNIFGTTMIGGNKARCGGAGCGVVYEIAAGSGQERLIYAFQGSADGSNPMGGVVGDTDGNLYGATYGGGAGYGVLFELSPGRKVYTETVLHDFGGVRDASNPSSAPLLVSGTLYGTLEFGGFGRCPNGCGAVYAYQLRQ